MNEINWKQIETIVDQALDLPKEQRLRFIKTECKGKPKLEGEVTQLLDSISNSEGWLENLEKYKRDMYDELADNIELLSSEKSLIGSKVGSYQIEEKIGEGGMGSVYLAKHSSGDIKHSVAIKIIRSEKATSDNIKRFKREQKILAGLHHPGIARMYDAGTTSDGYPYLIMEYIDGIPINDYCEKNECTLGKRLDLFIDVLQALRHAHENLVIHRDLKPGNILVDRSGHIKILDFGISKLIEDEEDNSLTKTGAHLLTPRYAAPEQVLQENITTATDLYALGIIFYQLTSGHYPFDFKELSRHEMEQAIIKQEACKPSTKVSDPKVKKQLQGDLDAIALKAIRKESEHRYRMANEFLEDLKNFQKGNPVTAREDSFRYRSQKFFKRHKQGIAVTAGILLFLIGLTSFYTFRIAQERDQAQVQAQRAELQAERAKQVSEFMISLFKSNYPENTLGEDIPVSSVINAGIENLSKQEMSPVNRATILGVIAQVQVKLSDIESAKKLSTQAFNLVIDSVDNHNLGTVDVPTIYGQVAYQSGDFEEAYQAFKIGDSLYKANDLTNTYEYRTLKYNLVNLYTEQKKYQEALQVLGLLDPETYGDDREAIIEKSDFYNYKAIALKNLGRQTEALSIYKKALEYRLEAYGPNNPEVGTIYNNISSLYISLDQYEEALEYAEMAYKIRKNTLGPSHSLTATPLWSLSVIHRNLNNYEEALRYADEAGTILKETLGADHWRYATTIRGQAEVLIKMEEFLNAKKKADKAIEIINTNYASNMTFKALFSATYTGIYKGLEDLDKAAEYYSSSISFFKEGLGENHPQVTQMLISYAKMEMSRQNYEKAQPLLKEAFKIQKNNEQSDEELKVTQTLIDESVKKLQRASTASSK
ncbi:protein kinase domain-containing protein [Gracilimonas sp. Q87]|uniref:protein kinase domain-containing protein n=1 Tax=Gracilimonas sp. Q87 TaxID=3384766 RepID=UPI0039844136